MFIWICVNFRIRNWHCQWTIWHQLWQNMALMSRSLHISSEIMWKKDVKLCMIHIWNFFSILSYCLCSKWYYEDITFFYKWKSISCTTVVKILYFEKNKESFFWVFWDGNCGRGVIKSNKDLITARPYDSLLLIFMYFSEIVRLNMKLLTFIRYFHM